MPIRTKIYFNVCQMVWKKKKTPRWKVVTLSSVFFFKPFPKGLFTNYVSGRRGGRVWKMLTMADEGEAGIFILYLDFIAAATLGV